MSSGRVIDCSRAGSITRAPLIALAFGAVGAVAGYLGAVVLKRLLNVDDSLDVFGLHGVAGLAGSVAVGVLATNQAKASVAIQLFATSVIAVYAFVVTLLIVAALRALGTWRAAVDEELEGLDISQHAESV